MPPGRRRSPTSSPGACRRQRDSRLTTFSGRRWSATGRAASHPSGYYEDSFDHVALRAAVLAAQGLVIVDGIFLFRPELDDLWTFRIFVHVELEESIRRGVERDGAAREELYRRRYAPGQRLYLHAVRPAELADVILDNSDPDEPRLSPGGADRRS